MSFITDRDPTKSDPPPWGIPATIAWLLFAFLVSVVVATGVYAAWQADRANARTFTYDGVVITIGTLVSIPVQVTVLAFAARLRRWTPASYFALGPDATKHATEYINHNYGYNPELAAKRLSTLPASDEAVRTAIQRQADMGVDEFILRPCAEDLDQLHRLAELAANIK